MLWEELTAGEFEKAREECKRTCIIPLGVIEKHNGHLPLGTDMLIGRKVAEEAAKREPVVIFPYYFFGQINEARHTPGTIAIRPDLLFSLLDEVCSEICRNGFNKIGILSSHGAILNLSSFSCNVRYIRRRTMYYTIFPCWILKRRQERNWQKSSRPINSEDMQETLKPRQY